METAIVVVAIFAIIVLVLVWRYRHSIKLAIKGPAGISLEVEAESAPPKQVTNAAGVVQIMGTSDAERVMSRRRQLPADLADFAGRERMVAKVKQLRWRWDCGTISTNLDGIWGMSAKRDHAELE